MQKRSTPFVALLVLGYLSASSVLGQMMVVASANATFLHTRNDPAATPTIVNLQAAGFSPGDTIELSYTMPPPGYSYWPGGYTVPAEQAPLLGVFSGSSVLLGLDMLARVPGAIYVGVDYISGLTWLGREPTDIPQDFPIFPNTGYNIQVPPGATHLFLGTVDSYVSDNLGTFHVVIRRAQPTTPAPDPAYFAQAPGPIRDPDTTVVSTPLDSLQSGLPNVVYGPTGEQQGALPTDPNAPPAYYDDYAGVNYYASLLSFMSCRSPWLSTLVGNPVHLFTGRVHLNVTDIGLGTCCGSLMFERTYSSSSTRRGQIGVGWSHVFERCLLDLGTQGAMEVDGRGVGLLFPSNGAGGYLPPSQGGASLTKETDGSWTSRYRAGTIYHYRPGSSAPQSITTIQLLVDGKSTFLHTVNDPAPAPTVVDLSASGIAPGDTIRLSFYIPPPGFSYYSCTGPFYPLDYLAGVFSSTNILLPTSARARVPNAIDAGIDIFTGPTYQGNEAGDIPEDFRISAGGSSIVVPTGATHIFLGTTNSYYSDNCGTLHVQLRKETPIAVSQISKLKAIEHANGGSAQMVYNTNDDLVKVTTCTGPYLEFDVQGGLIRKVTSSVGQEVSFEYTADERLAAAIGIRGGKTSYTYAPSTGDLAAIVRPSGDRTDYLYDTDRRVSETRLTSREGRVAVNRIQYPTSLNRTFIDPVGRVTQYEFDQSGNLSRRIQNDGTSFSITYDAQGRPLSVTLPDGAVQRWTYGSDGKILSFISPGGNTTLVEWNPVSGVPSSLIRPDLTTVSKRFDSVGNLIATTDALRRTTEYVRDNRGRIVQVIDPLRRTSTRVFDSKGDLVETIDLAGQVTRFSRDALGRPIATTSPGGRVTRTEYSGLGLVTAQTDSSGGRTIYEHDELGRLTATTLPNGARTEQKYERINGHDLVVEVKDALGNISRTVYDDSGRMIAQIDRLGRRVRFELDSIGRVVKTVYPDGNFSITRYNARGLVSETENARGAVTRFFYDADGQLLRTELPDGSTTSQTYDQLGRVISRTAADGGVQLSVYDTAGQLIASIDSLGYITRTEYTQSGAAARTLNPRDKVTRFTHDALDRVIESTNALGHTNTQAYGPDGETILAVNANGAQVQYRYDQLGRLTDTIDPLGHTVRRAYDSVGNLFSLTDENGHGWSFTYDLLGRKTSATDPNQKTTQFQYNAVGELVLVIFPDRAKWRYTRDAAGRVLERRLEKADGTVEDTDRYEYDIVGNRLIAENSAVRITSTCDIMDREIRRTVLYKATGAKRELSFTYNSMGQRSTMLDSHGRALVYSYDTLSRPKTITVVEPQTGYCGLERPFRTRAYSFSWDATSNLTQVDYPNRTRTRRTFDALNQLTELVHERVDGARVFTLQSFKYTRDAVGNITQMVNERGETFKYTHDLKGQLVRALLPRSLVARIRAKDDAKASGSRKDEEDDEGDEDDECRPDAEEISWRFDPAGNRTEENIGGRVIRSTFSPANELLTRGRIGYRYDERGNQVEKVYPSGQRQAFAYNVANQLMAFSKGHESRKRAQLKEVERYLYSTENERISVENVSGKKTTNFLWDGGRPLEEWRQIGHGAGKKDRGVLYARDPGGQLLDQVRYHRTPAGTHADSDSGGDDDSDDEDEDPGPRSVKFRHVRFVYPDHVGSTSLITNAHGRRLDRLVYSPWGVPLTGNFSRTRFGYTGHQREAATGNWYSMYRYLDSRAGRWGQRDPLGDIDSTNRYLYVNNRPIVAVDRRGLEIVRNVDSDKLIAIAGRFAPTNKMIEEINNQCEYKVLVNIRSPADRLITQNGFNMPLQPGVKFGVDELLDLLLSNESPVLGYTPTAPVKLDAKTYRIEINVMQWGHMMWAKLDEAAAIRGANAQVRIATHAIWRRGQPTFAGSPDTAMAITFVHELEHALQTIRGLRRSEPPAEAMAAEYIRMTGGE